MSRLAKYVLVIAVATIGIAATTQDRDIYFEISKNIEIFVNTYKELAFNYVDEVDPNELMRVGVDAMVNSLDPYTNFISENQVERYRINKDGKYEGIGARMDVVDDYFTVLEPFENGPAMLAGLLAGDQILEIDGQSTYQRDLEEIRRIARGAPGTVMNLKVKRYDGSTEMVELNRGDATQANVPYSGIVKDNVGYIKLTTFTGGAYMNISKALKKLRKEDPSLKGVILDLRNNGGGLLAEAVDICGLFVPQGELVVTNKGKVKDRDQPFKTRRTPQELDLPVAVLINKKSASASEIVSGVLQDYDRGVLIGQRSFGKGLVQNTSEVGYNNRVKLTTAKYYIPSGRCIQSVEYDNGEPVDIPDDRRSKFKTQNGRTVLDGGGVSPDVETTPVVPTELVSALQDQHMIFKYVNGWVAKHDKVDSTGQFSFTDYADFEAFLKKEKFAYETKAENHLKGLKEDVDGQYDAEITQLSKAIEKRKSTAMTDDKAQIVKLIEQEIVGRYYYEGGKAHQALNGDHEVLKAIEILNDDARYKSILK